MVYGKGDVTEFRPDMTGESPVVTKLFFIIFRWSILEVTVVIHQMIRRHL